MTSSTNAAAVAAVAAVVAVAVSLSADGTAAGVLPRVPAAAAAGEG